MKQILLSLLIALLLCGCFPQMPVQSTSSTAPEQSQTLSTTATDPYQIPPSTPTVATTLPQIQADPLQELLNAMTIEEKVGQLFLARCPSKDAIEEIAHYNFGGFVLFARDFQEETISSASATIAAYQAASSIPMLMAVDEEGGTVTRISRFPAFRSHRFSSPRQLFSEGGLALIAATEEEKCRLLGSIGINVNLGPVCDISTDPNAFMYQRSLGQSPEICGEFVEMMTSIMSQYQIGSVLKHFPGYGNNADTHIGIAVDERSLSELESADLVPFAAGIQVGCDAIMVSHVYITALDSMLPATLSPTVHTYLRQQMGFSGVIITDDLAMDAITDTYGAAESAVLAVLAGNDMLCVSDYAPQYEAVLSAVHSGRISQERLNEAVMRILKWKSKLGLLE